MGGWVGGWVYHSLDLFSRVLKKRTVPSGQTQRCQKYESMRTERRMPVNPLCIGLGGWVGGWNEVREFGVGWVGGWVGGRRRGRCFLAIHPALLPEVGVEEDTEEDAG